MARRRKKQAKRRLKKSVPRKGARGKSRKPPTSTRTSKPFLKQHKVPYVAYNLRFTHKVVDGDMVVGIESPTLKRLVNGYWRRFRRGIVAGRLLIYTRVGMGRGRKSIEKVVSTKRMSIESADSWIDLLLDFSSLSLTLHGYDSIELGADEDVDIRIRVHRVELELIHVEKERSIDIPKRISKSIRQP